MDRYFYVFTEIRKNQQTLRSSCSPFPYIFLTRRAYTNATIAAISLVNYRVAIILTTMIERIGTRTAAASSPKNYACHARDLFFRTDKGDFRVRFPPLLARRDPITAFPDQIEKLSRAREEIARASLAATRERESERGEPKSREISQLFISSARGSALNLARRGPSGMSPSHFITTALPARNAVPIGSGPRLLFGAFRELPLTERSSDGGLSPSFPCPPPPNPCTQLDNTPVIIYYDARNTGLRLRATAFCAFE